MSVIRPEFTLLPNTLQKSERVKALSYTSQKSRRQSTKFKETEITGLSISALPEYQRHFFPNQF